MKPHDPYPPLLKELADSNDCCNENELRISLQKTQKHVKYLREQYKKSPSQVDYSDPYNRAAYLLAYYPFYIEVVYHALCQLPQEIILPVLNQNKLDVCFLGSGPAPEVLGLIAYLDQYVPVVEHLHAYLLDINKWGWQKGQEITRYHLAPLYWKKKLVLSSYEFDFLNLPEKFEDPTEYAIDHSSFFVMQNCLNDQLKVEDKLFENFLRFFEFLKPNAVFVIADLQFPRIEKFMFRIEQAVIEQGLGSIVRSVSDGGRTIQPNFEIPLIVLEELLTGKDNLIPRKNVNYHLSIFRREKYLLY